MVVTSAGSLFTTRSRAPPEACCEPVLCSWHGRAQQWDISTGKHLRELNCEDEHNRNDGAMDICLHNENIITGNSVGEGAMMWDAGTGERLENFRTSEGWVNCVAVTGNLLCTSSSDCTVKVYSCV